jgi:hypothetical protein
LTAAGVGNSTIGNTKLSLAPNCVKKFAIVVPEARRSASRSDS